MRATVAGWKSVSSAPGLKRHDLVRGLTKNALGPNARSLIPSWPGRKGKPEGGPGRRDAPDPLSSKPCSRKENFRQPPRGYLSTSAVSPVFSGRFPEGAGDW